MKALVIAFLVLIPSGQAQNKPTSPNRQANHKTSTPDNAPPIKAALGSDGGSSGTSNQHNEKSAKETKIFGLTPDGFAQSFLALILACITGIYAFLTWRMLRKVGDQVKIMEQQVHNAAEQVIAAQGTNNRISHQIRIMQTANDQTNRLIEQATASAEAAQKSADALIDSERAWIGAEFVDKGSYRYELHVTNYGRTPGKITNFKCGARCIIAWQKFEPFSDMVTFPDNNLLLIPNEPHTLADFVLTDYFAEEWIEVLLGTKQAIMCATVYYEDMTRRPHETSFCYMYRIPSAKMEEVREHRKYS